MLIRRETKLVGSLLLVKLTFTISRLLKGRSNLKRKRINKGAWWCIGSIGSWWITMFFNPELKQFFFPFPEDDVKTLVYALVDFLAVIPMFLLIIRSKNFTRMKKITFAVLIVKVLTTLTLVYNWSLGDNGGFGMIVMCWFCFYLVMAAFYMQYSSKEKIG